MACRKAAYRAMTELSEFMEKQQAEAAAKQEVFEKEQKEIWTPPHVLDVCCSQWLAHGHEVQGHRAAFAASRGCSGGCSKAHPRITLDYKATQGSVATLSHALDPFVNYFETELPLEARKIVPLKYQLKGLLSTHAEILKAKFGSHLIKVTPGALAASQRANERQLEHEELERQAKRRKLQGKPADGNLLESVLEICYDHCLLEHLDLADIAWMRQSCKALGKIAARMARTRMKQIKLSYSVLVNGEEVRCTEETRPDVSREGTIQLLRDRRYLRYQVLASHRPLCLASSSKTADNNNDTFVSVSENNNRYEEDWNPFLAHAVRVYLEGTKDGTTTSCPERDVLFDQPVEVARFQFFARRDLVNCCPRLRYETTTTMEGEQGVTTVNTFTFGSFQFGFQDLHGIYARKKLPVAKAKYMASEPKKPAEKQYVKALAKAAREAPGGSSAFRGLFGW